MKSVATAARSLAISCVLVTLALAGCGTKKNSAPSVDSLAAKYAQLPGLSASSSPALQAALRELTAEQQLLASPASQSSAAPYSSLEQAYPEISRAGLSRDVQELWPTERFQFSPGALQRTRELIASHAAARSRFASAVDQLSLQSHAQITQRLSSSGSWLDAASLGARMEGLAAAETLAEGVPDEAIPQLARMLKLIAHLAREPSLDARLTAAASRRDSLQVLAAIANHPAATRETLTRLQQTLSVHTSDWPAEETVWIAERAAGLLVYELVRDGHYVDQLPREDLAELDRLGLASATRTAALRNVDEDELFYLRAMQLQIAAARLPYFQRLTAIEQLQTELDIRRDSGDFPLVAGSLLLDDVAEIHRLLAEDRCRCEAWLIALAGALQQPLGILPPNPLTGNSYVVLFDNQIEMTNLGLPAGEQIQLRRPGVLQAQRRAAGFDLLQR